MTTSIAQAIATGAAPAHATLQETGERRYLYGPVADFLCLGGISLLLTPIIFMLPAKELSPYFVIIVLGVAHFINHPHFAFSYQIFYENFLNKAFGPDNEVALRTRYIFAGIVVPVALGKSVV